MGPNVGGQLTKEVETYISVSDTMHYRSSVAYKTIIS
jgi:hypothetical protein